MAAWRREWSCAVLIEDGWNGSAAVELAVVDIVDRAATWTRAQSMPPPERRGSRHYAERRTTSDCGGMTRVSVVAVCSQVEKLAD
jgi:hypothetical protein